MGAATLTAVPLALPAAAQTPTCLGFQATPGHLGTGGNDVIMGTPGDDVIIGLGGRDTINGLGGNDIICGGGGRDNIRGGEGIDSIYGNAGADVLYGDAGADVIWGGPGNDTIRGGGGPDTLRGNAKNDRLFGQSGNDLCNGDAGTDTHTDCERDTNSEAGVKVMIIGDGVSQGAAGQVSYRPRLMAKLDNAGCSVNMVGRTAGHRTGPNINSPVPNWALDQSHEAGFGDSSTWKVLAGIDAALAVNTPDIAVIQLGTDDVFRYGQNGNSSYVPSAANLRAIIAKLRADNPSVKIVLSNVYPMDFVKLIDRHSTNQNLSLPDSGDDTLLDNVYNPTRVDGITKINAQIAQVAATENTAASPITFVNIYGGLNGNIANLSADGVVPNIAGEKKLAAKFANAIIPLVPGC
jgi:Ca2+-binding RTX toxin-like protein